MAAAAPPPTKRPRRLAKITLLPVLPPGSSSRLLLRQSWASGFALTTEQKAFSESMGVALVPVGALREAAEASEGLLSRGDAEGAGTWRMVRMASRGVEGRGPGGAFAPHGDACTDRAAYVMCFEMESQAFPGPQMVGEHGWAVGFFGEDGALTTLDSLDGFFFNLQTMRTLVHVWKCTSFFKDTPEDAEVLCVIQQPILKDGENAFHFHGTTLSLISGSQEDDKHPTPEHAALEELMEEASVVLDSTDHLTLLCEVKQESERLLNGGETRGGQTRFVYTSMGHLRILDAARDAHRQLHPRTFLKGGVKTSKE